MNKVKERNRLIEVKYKKILHDGTDKDAYWIEFPNGIKEWLSKGACKLNITDKVIFVPKWMYDAREKEGRWEFRKEKFGDELNEIENEINVEIINEEKMNEEVGNDQKITPEEILKGIIPPSKRRKLRGKVIKLTTGGNKVIFSHMQMFDFAFPSTIAFSFTNGKVYCIPNPDITGLNGYDVKAYGKGNDSIVQNQGLVEDLMSFLQLDTNTKIHYLESKLYSETGSSLRIFEVSMVKL